VLGITGASGVVYGCELAKALVERGKEVHLVVSDPGWDLISMELGLDRSELEGLVHRVYDAIEMDSPLSSGSYLFDSMAIVPCSMRTLGAIASGSSGSLIPRVAEVCLKERRRLVLVPRETPLSLTHIRNMETLTLAGAVILPAMPGFYHDPHTIQDLVNHVVGKIMDQLGIEHDIFKRWTGPPHSPGS
jgi:4-hydroxy-3-polyprenylbenzoate decarboxylase